MSKVHASCTHPRFWSTASSSCVERMICWLSEHLTLQQVHALVLPPWPPPFMLRTTLWRLLLFAPEAHAPACFSM